MDMMSLWHCYNRKILRWCAVKHPIYLSMMSLFLFFLLALHFSYLPAGVDSIYLEIFDEVRTFNFPVRSIHCPYILAKLFDFLPYSPLILDFCLLLICI